MLKCVDCLGDGRHQVALQEDGKLAGVCVILILAVAYKPKWFWNRLRSNLASKLSRSLTLGASDMPEQAQPAANM